MSRSAKESSVPPLPTSVLWRFRQYWRGGLAAGLAVTLTLALRWQHVESNVFESSALVEARAVQAQAGGEQAVPLEARVRAAAPELRASALRGNELDGPRSAIVKQISENRLLFLCRDDDPSSAQRLCANIVSRAMSALGAARLVKGASLPTAPLGTSPGAAGTIWLVSLLAGLLAALAWMLLRARGDEGEAEPEPSTQPVMSSIPPAPARADAAGSSLRPREGAPPAGASLPPMSAVTGLDVGPEWEYQTELSARTDARVEALCDQLFVAAASTSLVVGVCSMVDDRELKSRVAAHLAWRLSLMGEARILLMEADFDYPSANEFIGLDAPPRAGFSQQLLGRVHGDRSQPWTVLRCSETLSALLEGRVRTPGMLSSPALDPGLKQLRKSFDIIVADGPSADHAKECRAFARVIDAVVFVSSSSTRDAQAQVSALFPRQRLALPLGSVARAGYEPAQSLQPDR